MDAGLNGSNTRHLVDILALATKLGPDLCGALLEIHAFPGSDYTAAFMKKSKVKSFKILEISDSYAATLFNLGAHEGEYDDLVPTIEEFVCKMYGQL